MDELALRIENRQLRDQHLKLSAIVTAVLLKTGAVDLSKEEAEAVYDDATLRSEPLPDGGLRLWVETPAEPGPG